MKIHEINYDIAFVIKEKDKNVLYINKNLKHYPELYRLVISHELLHCTSKNKYIDWKIELRDLFNLRKQWLITKFILSHPRSLYSILPVMRMNKKTIINWYIVAIIAIAIAIGVVILLTLLR